MNMKWIYVIIAIVGCLLMISGWASAGFSFENLFADKSVYTEVNKTENIGANDTIEIKTDVERISVSPSDDESVHISYFDCEKKKHLYSYEGGKLSLTIDNSARKWYDYISFNFAFSEKTIEVRLPQSFKGKLYVREATGRVDIENTSGLEIMDFSLTTGDLKVNNCEAKEARLTTTTGRLGVSSLKADTLNAESTTGSISLTELTVSALTSRFATGSLQIANASCDNIDARGTTGNIKLDRVIANDITLHATTGSITGNIACGAEEFTIRSSTVTGGNNLKNMNHSGARKLNVECTTGSININFAK